MPPLISNLIVIALVAAAALVMGRRALRTLRGSRTGCGCERCPALKQRGGASAGRGGQAGGPPPASTPTPTPMPPPGAAAGAGAGSAQRGA